MEQIKIGITQVIRSSGARWIKLLKLIDLLLGTSIAVMVKGREGSSAASVNITSVLIIRPGGIGDAIFLLPFLRRIKEQRPDVCVDILCEKRNAQIFLSQPGICRNVYRYDDLASFYTLSALRYSLIIDTEQWHYSSALLSYFLKPEITIGFATRPLRTKLFDQKVPYAIDEYEILNFQNLFSPVILENRAISGIMNSYIVSSIASDWAASQIPKSSVTLSLGASIPERRFTEKQILSIIQHLLSKNVSVALLGGKDVEQDSQKLCLPINDQRLRNFVGKTSLEQSAALIKQSQLFIGPDSGLMHLASSVGTPVIAVFGPGNLKKWGPQGIHDRVICANCTCSPCTTFGYTLPVCQGKYPCMHLDMKHIFLEIDKSVKTTD